MRYKIYREVYRRLCDEESNYLANLSIISMFENEGIKIEYSNLPEDKNFIVILNDPKNYHYINRLPFLIPVEDEIFKEIDRDYLLSTRTDKIKIGGKEYTIKFTRFDMEKDCIDIYTNNCRFMEDKESRAESVLISDKLEKYYKLLNEEVEKINEKHKEFKQNKKPWEIWKKFDLSSRVFKIEGEKNDIIRVCCK